MAMRGPLGLQKNGPKFQEKWHAEAIALLKDRVRNDTSGAVCFEAACNLGEAGDTAGLDELPPERNSVLPASENPNALRWEREAAHRS
jgi:hypothetical protein